MTSKASTIRGDETGTCGGRARLAEPPFMPRHDLAGRRRVVYESIVHTDGIKSVGRREGAGRFEARQTKG